jgi:hypothetical protein
VDRHNALFNQQGGRARRESLIEQKLDHATRPIPKLSSSTVAAAYRSA